MGREPRYMLTEDDLEKIIDLSNSLGMALEKIIHNRKLPRFFDWTHPSIIDYEDMIEEELNRKNQPICLDDIF